MDTISLLSGATDSIISYVKSIFRMPYTPGYMPTASTFGPEANNFFSPGTTQYAWNSMHVIPYIAGMFMGYRGSVNYTFTLNNPYIDHNHLTVTRVTNKENIPESARYIEKEFELSKTANQSTKARTLGTRFHRPDDFAGMALTSTGPSPTLQVSLPDYNNFNFSLVNPENYIHGSIADNTLDQGMVLRVLTANDSSDLQAYTTLQTAACAGPDFTCLYFLGCPTLDYVKGVPSAP